MKFTFRKLATAALTVAILGSYAVQANAQPKSADGILVGANGMTLYTFDKDEAGNGKSMCSGACTASWPPLMASGTDTASGDLTIITREDGKKQWAAKGKPLYFWAKDTKPGDKTGDDFNKVWHTAKP